MSNNNIVNRVKNFVGWEEEEELEFNTNQNTELEQQSFAAGLTNKKRYYGSYVYCDRFLTVKNRELLILEGERTE